MSTSTLDDYADAAANLTPPAVAQFLAAHSWQLEAQLPHVKEVWRLPGPDGDKGRIMLPLATDYTDFTQRFRDALISLGHIHALDAVRLYEQIIATRADLFFVRLDQNMIDGTIPFSQAEKSLQALLRMMRAAATTAADPSHPQRGRRPASVSDFLEDDVRLAHTKRGSFVFTVVTRLGDPAPPDSSDMNVIKPFSRRVMETLARGLETTRRLTQEWDASVLDDPAGQGVSANLVESIEDLTQADHLRQVDLSFEWAAAEPRPDVGLATVSFDRDVMSELPRVRERLIRQEEPPRRVTLRGFVKTLSRENAPAGGEEIASVVLTADVNGKQRLVHSNLSGEDHEWAIKAYRQKLPFTVTGDLAYERRSWRLTGDIEVDPSFLQHQSGNVEG
ncbi:hypothetical protein ACIRJR_32715 [Streptomyces sp. NPDC102402]|uniref:hypothetical protein n=1 Tax=Streptomyces sp. NPDC102402 TaxID=3366169 RepID=UPI003826A828